MKLACDRRRFALQLLLFLACFFTAWSLRATVFYSLDEQIDSPILRAAYADLLKLVLWGLPAAVFASCVRKVAPGQYLGMSAAPGMRTWALCLVVTSAFLILVTATETLLGGKALTAGRLLSFPMAILLLQFVLSPLLEEILFRGLVLKELLLLLPAFLASVLNSLLFVAAHVPYWLFHGEALPVMAAKAAGIFLFSLLASWLFVRSSSIWPPVVAHIANNLLSVSLLVSQARTMQ
jgi:membrane protease YdiL (CAAX protease family)